MIPSAVWPRFARWFTHRAERRIASRFDRVRVRGLDLLRATSKGAPVLVVANHSAWWDGMLALWLSRGVLGLDAHALMAAENLLRHPYLARVGGFGVRQTSRRDGAEAMRHAAELLHGPGRCVWLFPQGEERPWHETLAFHPGVCGVAKRVPEAAVVPVALGYSFGAAERPLAWIAIGSPLASRSLPDIMQAVDAQREQILRGIEGRIAFDDHLVAADRPRLAERMLAWISGVGLRDEATAALHEQRALAPSEAARHRGAAPRQQE